MRSYLQKPWSMLICWLVLALVLAACGGDESTTQLEGARDTRSTPTPNATEVAAAPDGDAPAGDPDSIDLVNLTPAENTLTLPADPALQALGRLLIAQGHTSTISPGEGTGGRLYLAAFDGSPAQEVAQRVFMPSLAVAPDGRHAFFVAVEGRRWYAHVLDVETLEVARMNQLGTQFSFVSNWSPDGQWMTTNGFGSGLILLARDGSASLELGQGFAVFTQDNEVVVLHFDEDAPAPIELIQLPDLERAPLDLDIDSSANVLDVINAMRAAGYEPAANFDAASYFANSPLYIPEENAVLQVQNPNASNNPSGQQSPEVCAAINLNYQPLDAPEPVTLAQFQDTIMLSDITRTTEGYLFMRWYAEGCQLVVENLAAELIYLPQQQSGDAASPQVVAAPLYPGNDLALNFMRSRNGHRYSLAPDEQHVVWISGSLSSAATTLHIADLTSGTTAPLLTWQSRDANTFLGQEALNAVFWLPATP